jgi:hypothetical protein
VDIHPFEMAQMSANSGVIRQEATGEATLSLTTLCIAR